MCRVAGVFNHRFAASYVRMGLFSLQHGGQDSCGIGVPGLPVVKGLGLVDNVFPDTKVSRYLPGRSAIGQDRYATQGSIDIENAAPFEHLTSFGRYILSHNGHIMKDRYNKLRDFLVKKGMRFLGSNDGELMLNLIVYRVEQNGGDVIDAIQYAMKKVERTFSVILLTPDAMYAFRDRYGYRPLVLGKKKRAHFVASETCALDKCGARYVREVNPGEIVRISKADIISFIGRKCNGCQKCIFELIYFAFPSSTVFGIDVWEFQRSMGARMGTLFAPTFAELVRQYGRDKVIICPVPDTARVATLQFCRKLGATELYDECLIRSHFTGRTFMSPEQVMRDLKVKLKFSFIKKLVQGKVVVILDDSIVRGSTLREMIRILKEKCGALAVHVVIYSPQIIGSCHMGIDTPTIIELIANRKGDAAKVAKYLGADGLLHCRVQDLRDVIASFDQNPSGFCYSCFTGRYRFRIPRQPS